MILTRTQGRLGGRARGPGGTADPVMTEARPKCPARPLSSSRLAPHERARTAGSGEGHGGQGLSVVRPALPGRQHTLSSQPCPRGHVCCWRKTNPRFLPRGPAPAPEGQASLAEPPTCLASPRLPAPAPAREETAAPSSQLWKPQPGPASSRQTRPAWSPQSEQRCHLQSLRSDLRKRKPWLPDFPGRGLAST